MNVSFWAALIHHESKISGGSIVFKFEIWWRYVKTSNLTSHRSVWFPLLSACWLVEFDTSIICHVLLYCFGSFLSQDLFKYSLLRDKIWACCLLAFYIVAPGPSMAAQFFTFVPHGEQTIEGNEFFSSKWRDRLAQNIFPFLCGAVKMFWVVIHPV